LNKVKSIYVSLILVLLIAMALVACQPSGPTPTPTATKPAATGPKMGGILNITAQNDARYLGNAPLMTTVQDSFYTKPVVEYLGRYEANGEIKPYLAESWKVDAATNSITITLKKGIKFSDGTPFDAAAVKWNIDHFIAAKRAELPAGTTVNVIDDSTVRLTLSKWDNTAIIGMAYYAAPMISPTAWQKAGATDKERDDNSSANPVGTGPFMLSSWQKTVKIAFKKNPTYWQQGKPYLDGININLIVDPLVAMASYKSKEQDQIFLVTPKNAADLKAAGANIVALNTGLGLQQTSVWYNSILPDSPFAKLQVRQAVSYAVDAKQIVSSLFYGYATPINQWAVPTSQYANPDFKGYPYDPNKAKALLAEAGYPNLSTKMLVSNNPDNINIATALQSMFKAAGMNVEIDAVDDAKYRNLTSPGGSFTQMCLASQRANSDPAIIFPRNLSDSGVIMNKTIIHPAEIEKLLVDAKLAPDNDAKKKVIWNLQKVVFGDYCIFTPLWVPSGLAAKQPYCKGDGIMEIEYTQWTPETAWLDK
jgi:peptide/nickel transport system substrate-binding protein